MTSSNPDLLADDFFAPEPESPKQDRLSPWQILVVDDEPQVHEVTQLALRGFDFNGRGLAIHSAYSAEQARKILSQEPDIAVVLLDVVMETEHAGLDLARWIRGPLKNSAVRIILRTGQPGQAPERNVIRDYDINDYKAKTDLTVQKLYTLLYTALRAFEHIQILERSKAGMEEVIKATRNIIGKNNFINFAQATLEQLMTMLTLDDAVVLTIGEPDPKLEDAQVEIICSAGRFTEFQGYLQLKHLPFADQVTRAMTEHQPQFGQHDMLLFCENKLHRSLFYVVSSRVIGEMDRHLMSLFAENILIALENTTLNEQFRNSQREIIYRLTEVVENRSLETGNHVKRVARYCHTLGQLLGMSEADCQTLLIASPLHDIGKVGTPDRVLHKPGKLNADEWIIMQQHAAEGERILSGSELAMLDAGAIIAGNHHERWDGNGYPKGLAGEAIPLMARITTLADVFDALTSKRCYKEAWPIQTAIDYITQQSGQLFDPQLVALFLDNIDKFIRIRQELKDDDEVLS